MRHSFRLFTSAASFLRIVMALLALPRAQLDSRRPGSSRTLPSRPRARSILAWSLSGGPGPARENQVGSPFHRVGGAGVGAVPKGTHEGATTRSGGDDRRGGGGVAGGDAARF